MSGTALTAILRMAGLAAVAALSACGGDERAAAPEVVIRGTDPMAAAPAAGAVSPAPVAATADPRGVVDYGDYKVVIARGGETVAELAQQVGLSAAELAAHNGLTPAHTMRAGDELVLPAGPGASADTLLAAAEPATSVMAGAAPVESAIETAPLSNAIGEPDPLAPIAPEPLAGLGSDSQPADPAQIAAEPSPGEPWSPDLAAAAIERSSVRNPDGGLGAPPSASDPIPPEPPARQELESPDLGQYQTGAAGSPLPPAVPDVALVVAPEASAAPGQELALLRPVEGPVAVGFNKSSGPERNDGVDFAAPAGAPVIAAADGEVALVSPSMGGLGNIVLLRHSNGLLTVYGRIDGVTVQKGDTVQAGQRIGAVSNPTAPDEPRLHFEVRRGAESLDPMQFL